MTTQKFPIGSHLKVSRQGYSHHGIYIGDDQVIHYEGFSEIFKYGPICCVSLAEFQGSSKYISIVSYRDCDIMFSPAQIVERAKSRLSENKYSLVTNNCEHFAHWCITGKSASRQVKIAIQTVVGILAIGGTLFANTSHAGFWV